MRESKNCHHRFAVHEENLGFLTDDGIEVFIAGARFQKTISCGHKETTTDMDEILTGSLLERRNEPSAPKNLYLNLINF
ncbi:hypothetical protein M3182_20450 [Mesobacillus maritimus]|uniref:hypothetical protein n=1 Tax=Mesobacillus maritimus TaxID=1643336 RepID=UPI00203F804B|nr:hypothetical protein [Mesobacillus maritimus]MCM3588078.1 hypothetical protein [Mesobacillus maritimus]MCM3668409.1 hypothetical protein [Mesobacillus maritimus]